jgi:hypothetical protein
VNSLLPHRNGEAAFCNRRSDEEAEPFAEREEACHGPAAQDAAKDRGAAGDQAGRTGSAAPPLGPRQSSRTSSPSTQPDLQPGVLTSERPSSAPELANLGGALNSTV